MAKVERKDDGRRCLACGGPATAGLLSRYVTDHGTPHDFHPVCVGAWLMSNPAVLLAFTPGEV